MNPTYQNFDPPPSAPEFFLSCGKPGWQQHAEAQRIHTLPPVSRQALPVRHASRHVTGNNSSPCCASRPCGVCVVAHCPFSVGEEREHRAYQLASTPCGGRGEVEVSERSSRRMPAAYPQVFSGRRSRLASHDRIPPADTLRTQRRNA
jgi:hypothetical protein